MPDSSKQYFHLFFKIWRIKRTKIPDYKDEAIPIVTIEKGSSLYSWFLPGKQNRLYHL